MEQLFYIAGPIFGKGMDLNLPEFERVARLAKLKLGCRTLIPHNIEPYGHAGKCPPGRQTEAEQHAAPCHMRADIRAMLMCDGIILLPGWQTSQGAQLEMQVASACGLSVYQAGHLDTLAQIC